MLDVRIDYKTRKVLWRHNSFSHSNIRIIKCFQEFLLSGVTNNFSLTEHFYKRVRSYHSDMFHAVH